jgi:hypothetical protein
VNVLLAFFVVRSKGSQRAAGDEFGDGAMDDLVRQVVEAVEQRDWETLRRVLHPYLHWTEDGVTVRGRQKVLARLVDRPVVGVPASYEVRDGQVYRWAMSSEDFGS